MIRLVLETQCWLQMGAWPDGMEEGLLGSCGPHWGWDAEGRHRGLGGACGQEVGVRGAMLKEGKTQGFCRGPWMTCL